MTLVARPDGPLSPDEWRQCADVIALAMRFNLERVYLGATQEQFRKQLRHTTGPSDNANQPTAWLRLDRIGEPSEKGLLDPATALQLALSSCHRPGGSRLLFAAHGDGRRYAVFLGIRSLDFMTDSSDLAAPAKAFVEANWPATRLVHCTPDDSPERTIAAALRDYRGRYSLTGVPAFLDRVATRHPQSLDLLLDGLRGRRFLYLVVADPLTFDQETRIISKARDLIGALHAFGRATVTHSDSETRGVTRGTSSSVTRTSAQADQRGTARSYVTPADVLKVVALGGLGLAPLCPPLALCGGLAGIMSLMMPQTRSDSVGSTTTTSRATAEGTSESVSHSLSRATALAREYVNAHVQATEVQLRRLAERVNGQKCWDVGTYLLTEHDRDGQDATAQLAALLNGTRRHGEEPIRFQNLGAFWKDKAEKDLAATRRPRFEVVTEGSGDRLAHPLGPSFDGLSTPLNSEELSLLVSFPRREVPGIKARPSAAFTLNPADADGPSVELGEVLRGDDPVGARMRVSLASLTKNVLVTGTVGSGKSTTCRGLLRQLLAASVPFLVIEPAKSEYVEWARRVNESLAPDDPNRIQVYKPGARPGTGGPNHRELRLNPFQVVSPDQVVLHIERLKALLTMSLPMQEALPLLLEGILYGIYAKNGWFSEAPGRTPPRTPTLAQLLLARSGGDEPVGGGAVPTVDGPPQLFLDDFVRSKGYEDRVAANLVAALKTRFESLRAGWKKSVFGCSTSTPFAELFGRPAIVNLSLLGDDFSRSLTAGLLMGFLHEWRQADQEAQQTTAPCSLRHLVVLEEAHCLLEPVRHVAAESMDPKGMVSRMFADQLSEMRAWGQGFLIIDQYPTRLILDAIKNTNLKIVHRLPSRDDQEVVAAAMSLDHAQSRLIPYLLPGQAIALGDRDDAPALIRIDPKEVL